MSASASALCAVRPLTPRPQTRLLGGGWGLWNYFFSCVNGILHLIPAFPPGHFLSNIYYIFIYKYIYIFSPVFIFIIFFRN